MASAADTTTTTDSTAATDLVGKAKAFAKQRPWAVGTLAAVLGLATLNTLRGRS